MEHRSTGVCECVVWREGERRCELWLISGRAQLRVFHGNELLREEPAARYGAYTRAHELRIETSEPRAQHTREWMGDHDAPTNDAPAIDDAPVPPLTTPDDTEGG